MRLRGRSIAGGRLGSWLGVTEASQPRARRGSTDRVRRSRGIHGEWRIVPIDRRDRSVDRAISSARFDESTGSSRFTGGSPPELPSEPAARFRSRSSDWPIDPWQPKFRDLIGAFSIARPRFFDWAAVRASGKCHIAESRRFCPAHSETVTSVPDWPLSAAFPSARAT